MTVLMTGATGFLGRALTLRLLAAGHTLRAWVRDPERARDQLGPDVALVRAGGPEAWARALAGVEGVVNLAGEPVMGRRWTARRRARLTASRVGVTRGLVAAIAALPAAARPRVLLSASAVGYYGDRGDEPVDEHSSPGRDFLARLCLEWEQAASSAEALGVRVTTPRLGFVLGLGGGALAPLARLGRLGLGGPLGRGRQYVPWIHLEDAVAALATALIDEHYRGPINLTAPEPVRQRDLARAVGRALHRPAFLPAPAAALYLVLGTAATALLHGQRARPRRLQELGFEFRHRFLDGALADLLGAAAAVAIGPARDVPAELGLRQRPPRSLLRQETVLAASLEEVFRFFADAENLGLLTPPDLRFRIVSPRPVRLAEGGGVEYTVRLGPLRVGWRTVIERFEPPLRFVDSQAQGPYRTWWHEHRFRATSGGRTVMEDRVYYSVPLGLLGRVVNWLFVAPALRRIFAYRAAAIRLRYGGAAPRAAAPAAEGARLTPDLTPSRSY
ncbi:MAG TPA: TIGR01777 family oxidoreductase [Polyangia bacterium]